MADQINPSHYKGFSNGAEVIDIAERLNFNRGNAIKYIARAGRKEGAATITDLEKAKWYLEREIARMIADGKEVAPGGSGVLIGGLAGTLGPVATGAAGDPSGGLRQGTQHG